MVMPKYFTGVLSHSAGSDTAATMYVRQDSNGTELAVYRGNSTSVVQTEVDGGWIVFSVTYFTS